MQRANRNRDTRYVVHVIFEDGETTNYEADRIQAIQNVLQLTRFDPNTPDDVYRAIHVASIPLSSLHEWVEEDRNPLCGKLYPSTNPDLGHVTCELNIEHLDTGENHGAMVAGNQILSWPVDNVNTPMRPGEFDNAKAASDEDVPVTNAQRETDWYKD